MAVPTRQEWDALQTKIDQSATAIKTRLDGYIAQLQGGGLSAAEEETVFNNMKAVVALLEPLGSTNNPAPPLPPEV